MNEFLKKMGKIYGGDDKTIPYEESQAYLRAVLAGVLDDEEERDQEAADSENKKGRDPRKKKKKKK